MEIRKYIEENEQRFIDELFSLIRIPSISALPQHKEDIYYHAFTRQPIGICRKESQS